MRRSFVFLGLVLSGVSLIAPLAVAQAQSVVPLVYARDLAVTVDAHRQVRGTFTAQNSEKRAVSDLHYEVLLIGPRPTIEPGKVVVDNALIYDRLLSAETFSLLPTATKQIPFSYTAPAVPAGTYRLRVQLKTSNDRPMGWATTEVTLGGQNSFGLLRAEAVKVTSTTFGTNQKQDTWQPGEGVNVDPEQALTLQANAQLIGEQLLTVQSQVTIRRALAAHTVTDTVVGETMTLDPATPSRTLSFPLKSYPTPGAYELSWTLVNPQTKEQLSSMADFRYVVRGVSASVTKVQVREFNPEADTTSVIDFMVVGPADRQTKLTGTLEVSLLDDGMVAGTIQENLQLSFAPAAGTAQIRATHAIAKPGIRLTLHSADGTVLDTYEVAFSDVTAEGLARATRRPFRAAWQVRLVVLGVLLAIMSSAFVIFWKRRHRSTTPPHIGVLLFGVVLTGIGFAAPRWVAAWGVTYSTPTAPVYAFFNLPVQEATFDGRYLVLYESNAWWPACNNYITQGALVVEAKSGRNVPTFNQWQQWYANDTNLITFHWPQGWQTLTSFSGEQNQAGGELGLLTFFSFPQKQHETNRKETLFSRYSVNFDYITNTTNDELTLVDNFTVINLTYPPVPTESPGVSPTPTPTPTPPVTPSPTPSVTPTPSPTVTPSPSPSPSPSVSPSPSPGSFFFWWPFKQTR